MRSIYIGSTGSGSGRSLMAWALGRRLTKELDRVGFFKPYEVEVACEKGVRIDPDARLMSESLGIGLESGALCSVTFEGPAPKDMDAELTAELMGMIETGFKKASAGKDAMIVMGSSELFFDTGPTELRDAAFIENFDSDVLLLDRYHTRSTSIYSILSINSFLGGRVKAAIINRVPPLELEEVTTSVIPLLQDKGLERVIAIPEDSILASCSVRNVVEALDGQVLSGRKQLNSLVDFYTIGSAHLVGPLAMLRLVHNKIVLVSPDGRGEGDGGEGPKATGVVLTGGRLPNESIVKLCKEERVPLINVQADTFTCMDRLEAMNPPITKADTLKIERFEEWIGRSGGIDRLIEPFHSG